MNYLAHTDSVLSGVAESNKWDWDSPLGLGFFMIAVVLTLALLAWTIKTLSSIDAEQKRRK